MTTPQCQQQTGNDVTINESETPGARHLVIKVKDFAVNPLTNQKMTSYLRLGAARDEMGASGDDKKLAEMVTSFRDDDRERDDFPRQDEYDGVSVEQRREISKKLHTLGGWRDHSDGNRISTTKGDKVEVVRGNYKLLVLGRQPEGENGADWEASGGHIVDGDIAPGAVTDIRWIKDELTGTWRVYEESAKGDVVTRYHGIVRQEILGSLQETIVGSASGHQPALPESLEDDEPAEYTEAERTGGTAIEIEGATEGFTKPAGATVLNPIVREQTWARSMEYQRGSASKPVERIVERTWAKRMVSRVGDDSNTVGTIDNSTYADDITTYTKADHIKETREADYFGTTLKIAREHWFGAFLEMFAGAHLSLRVGAPNVEITGGVGIEAFVGAAAQLFMGGVLDVTWAAKAEVSIGSMLEYNLGTRKSYGTIDEKDHLVTTGTSLTSVRKFLAGFYG
jgi:hypothetical protein